MIWALMKEPAPSHRRSEGEDRAPVDKPRSTVSADELKDRRSRDDQSQAAEPPAWRVLLAYARPYRLTLIVGGLLSLATGVVVPRISRAASRTQESVGAMGTALERVLGAMRTVKASGAEQREAQRVDQAAAQVWQAGVRAAKWRRWPATPPGWPSRCRSSSCSAWGGRPGRLGRDRRGHPHRLPAVPVLPAPADAGAGRGGQPIPGRRGRGRPHPPSRTAPGRTRQRPRRAAPARQRARRGRLRAGALPLPPRAARGPPRPQLHCPTAWWSSTPAASARSAPTPSY
jgi:hypothetical protein